MPLLTGEKVDFNRALVEAMIEGGLITRPDGVILSCNTHFSRMVQAPEAEIVNSHLRRFFPANEHAALDLTLDLAKTGKITEEFTLLTAGKPVPVELITSKLTLNLKSRFLILITDLNERKKQELALRESERRYRIDLIKLQEAQSALRQSEEQLRLFIETTPAAIAMFDTRMRYLAASARWLNFHGLSGNVTGLCHYDTSPEIPEHWKQVHQRTLAGAVERCEDDKFVRADGSVQYLMWEIRPWRTSTGEVGGIVIYAEDMTQRKKSEEALRLTNERFETALNHSDIMVYNQDLDLRYTWIHNPPRGYPHADHLIGKRAADVIDPEDAAAIDALKREVLASGAGMRREVRVRSQGADRFYDIMAQPSHDAKGAVTGLVCVGMDVTERHHSEDLLRESELRFRALFESAGDAIFIVDKTGRYVDVNARGAELLGYSRQEILERHIRDIVTERERPRIPEELTMLQTGRPRISEWEFLRKDGTIFLGEVNGQLLPDGRMMGIARDVTERSQAAAALLKAKEEVDRANKELELKVQERTAKLQETVAELEQYSYSITHDLRAPLRAIQGFVKLLDEESDGKLPPNCEDYLRHITDSSERMENLIRDSLNYGKILLGEIPLEPLEVASLIHGIIQSYPVLQPPQADVTLEGEFPLVQGNTAAMSQCVSNLLRNAVKFVAPGVAPRVRIYAETKGEYVRLSFQDNGIGIAPDAQERIFGMFEQLDKRYEGTGIGLAIVRKAVERMGGKVGVESAPGSGSRFWLDLKRAI